MWEIRKTDARSIDQRLSHLRWDYLETILLFLDKAYELADRAEDWWAGATFGFVVGYLGFGLRPKEYRPIPIGKYNSWSHQINISCSKTENSDYTTLLPPVEEYWEKYLVLRAKWMKKYGQNPSTKDGLIVPFLPTKRARSTEWTGPQVRKMFRELRSDGLPPIKPKDLRTSFGQILMDDCGRNMDKCSQGLRHASITTTQKFYVRLRPDDSYKRLKRDFKATHQRLKKRPQHT